MKAKVTEIFQDKFTKNHYSIGDVIEIDDFERMNSLKAKGLVQVVEDADISKTTTKRSKKNDRLGESGSK